MDKKNHGRCNCCCHKLGQCFRIPLVQSLRAKRANAALNPTGLKTGAVTRCFSPVATARQNVEAREWFARYLFEEEPLFNRSARRSILLRERRDARGCRCHVEAEIREMSARRIETFVEFSALQVRGLTLSCEIKSTVPPETRIFQGNMTPQS